MDRWRDLGYVPDSQDEEDEGDEIDVEALLRRPSTTNRSLADLQDESASNGDSKPLGVALTPASLRSSRQRKRILPEACSTTASRALSQSSKRPRHDSPDAEDDHVCTSPRPQSSPQALQHAASQTLPGAGHMSPRRINHAACVDQTPSTPSASSPLSSLVPEESLPATQQAIADPRLPHHTQAQHAAAADGQTAVGARPMPAKEAHAQPEAEVPAAPRGRTIQTPAMRSQNGAGAILEEEPQAPMPSNSCVESSQQDTAPDAAATDVAAQPSQQRSPPKYGGRALRPRTMVQQRPYQVELARYALFCKQRGIPFHMPRSREHPHEQQLLNGHRRDGGSDQDDGSFVADDLDSIDGSQLDHSSTQVAIQETDLLATSPRQLTRPRSRLQSSMRHTYSRSNAPSARPRLTATHDHSPVKPVTSEARQRVDSKAVANDQPLMHLLAIPEVTSSQEGSHPPSPQPSRNAAVTLLDALAHEDRSVSGQSDDRTQRQLLSVSPPARPRRTPTRFVLSDESDTHESDDALSPQPTLESTSSPPPRETKSTREVERLQKRIKGVLPASWVRLEMRLQQEKDRASRVREQRRSKQRSDRRLVDATARGVAQVISNTARNGPSHAAGDGHRDKRLGHQLDFLDDDAISHESDSSGPGEADPDFKGRGTRAWFNDLPAQPSPPRNNALGDEDIPEDNRIDYMLPPVPRDSRRSGANLRRQRQTRLNTQFLQSATGRHGTSARLPQPSRQGRAPVAQPLVAPSSTAAGARIPISRNRQTRLTGTDSQSPWTRGSTRDTSSSDAQAAGYTGHTPTLNAETSQDWFHGQGTTQFIPSNHQSSTRKPLEKSLSGNSLHTAINLDLDDAAGEGSAGDKQVKRRLPPRLPVRIHGIRRGYALTSGRRPGPRPVEVENVPMPPRLDRTALQTLEVKPGNRDQAPSALSSAHATDLRLRQAFANPQLQRYLSAERKRSELRADVGHTANAKPVALRSEQRQPNRQSRGLRRSQSGTSVQQSGHAIEDTGTGVPEQQYLTSGCNMKGLECLDNLAQLNLSNGRLRAGTYFATDTFVGSGQFSRCLQVDAGPLLSRHSVLTIHHADQIYQWSAWSETVASELAMLFQRVHTLHQSLYQSVADTQHADRPAELYRTLLRYVPEHLYCIDAIDQRDFVKKSLGLIREFALDATPCTEEGERQQQALWIKIFDLVLATQISRLAASEPYSADLDSEAKSVLLSAAQRLWEQIAFALSQPQASNAPALGATELESGPVQDTEPLPTALVVLHTLERREAWLARHLPTLKATVFASCIGDLQDLANLEHGWNVVSKLLPYADLDERGAVPADPQQLKSINQWSLIKVLLSPVLAAETTAMSIRSLDHYCRTLFARCYDLITSWGWLHWQDILQYLFSFFSKRRFRNLATEGLDGSPAFLTHLDENPSLQLAGSDSCFHVFLKTIGICWRHSDHAYDQHQLQNFARRLIPLHERQFPKDQPLVQEDLDELRNHHDLLCTLYWAIPEPYRFRVATVQWLVQPLLSHTEASVLNINAWLRLVRFKLVSGEELSGLEPFSTWFESFCTDMLKLHVLARTEMEAQALHHRGISKSFINSVIHENQKQVETLLGTALTNLRLALVCSPTMDHARLIFMGLPLTEMLDHFECTSPGAGAILQHIVDCILALAKPESPANTSQRRCIERLNANDESQGEYGDWSAVAELANEELVSPGPNVLFLDEVIRPALNKLRSACLSASVQTTDTLACRIIDCWVTINAILVRNGLRDWRKQFNPYHSESWVAQPRTQSARTLSSYIMTQVIRTDPSVLTSCRQEVLQCWMTCLVERGSLLKYQHLFTSAILDVASSHDPVVFNLPFYRTAQNYRITLQEFTSRRLSLLSSILSNMSMHLKGLQDHHGPELQCASTNYRQLIEGLMQAMKANYQELGTAAQRSQGQYVDFVQSVIGLLQQHVQHICPLDSFFTNPKTFPLPTADPTYLVARILSYELRLDDPKTGKQLVTFIQSVLERVILDGQQDYFASQLRSAIMQSIQAKRTTQAGSPLLDLLVACILPAYMTAVSQSPVAWILVRPFLDCLIGVFQRLILLVDTYDQQSVAYAIWVISCYFSSIEEAVGLPDTCPELLQDSRVLLALASCFGAVEACVSVLDYLSRSQCAVHPLVARCQLFYQKALHTQACLTNSGAAGAWSTDGRASADTAEQSPVTADFQNLRAFASSELATWLETTWAYRDDTCYVRQGPKWVAIAAQSQPRSLDAARSHFLTTIAHFTSLFSHYTTFDTHATHSQT